MKLEAIDARLRGKDKGDRRWSSTARDRPSSSIEGPVEFRMGSPREPIGEVPDEPLHPQSIPRRFAIAAKEVTLAQYQEFTREYPAFAMPGDDIKQYGLEPDRPDYRSELVSSRQPIATG